MKIEIYDSDKHFDMISSWHTDRGQSERSKNSLPKIGLVVNDIVAGFLYQTDSDIALIENVIAKKDTDKQFRRESIDILMFELFDIAKQLGFTKIISYTSNYYMLKEHGRWGFQKAETDCTVFVKVL